MATEMDVDDPEYALSVQLEGHSAPVRCVAVFPSNPDIIVTAGTKEDIFEWTRDEPDSPNFSLRSIFDGGLHPLCFCLVSRADGVLISGGSDNRAVVWTRDGEEQLYLLGHESSVNSLDVADTGEIVTGSFDTTAKIFVDGECTATLSGHEYGVEVCALESGQVVTGSHKDLHVWDMNGTKRQTLKNAHDHVIRKIRRHPLGFITAANDGYVKIWSNTGENIKMILAHPEDGERPSFIYGLCSTPTGDIISSGEDGTVKLFSPDGTCKQVMRHPGAVWSVAMLANGDIVTACADRAVRIWTCDSSRRASDEAIASYNEMLDMTANATGSGVDDSQLEDMSALNMPGTPGQYKMVRDPKNGPSVYQFDPASRDWQFVGQITGNPGGGGGGSGGGTSAGGASGASLGGARPMIDGIAYDYVTDVNLFEQNFRLGFNRDDDPAQVAYEFCMRHSVDLDCRPQIINHLKPMADPVARAARVEREKLEAQKALRQIPSFRVCKFEINGKANLTAMRDKIIEFNGLLLSEGNPNAVENDALLQRLFQVVLDQSHYHNGEFDPTLTNLVIGKLLAWPTDKILPILDMMRVLMQHMSAVTQLGDNPQAREAIARHLLADDVPPNSQMLACRLICNYLAKRPRSADERQGRNCPQDLVDFLVEALGSLSTCVSNPKKSIHIAYLMLVHNVIVWYAKFKIDESDVYLIVASALFELMEAQEHSDKLLYYSLSILGSIGWASPSARSELAEAFGDQLRVLAQEAQSRQGNTACQEVGRDVFTVFGF